MEIAVIRWVDATYNDGAWGRKELKKDYNLVEILTVGQLFEEREDCYVLASEHQITEDTFRHIIAIPKSGIKSISILTHEEAMDESS